MQRQVVSKEKLQKLFNERLNELIGKDLVVIGGITPLSGEDVDGSNWSKSFVLERCAIDKDVALEKIHQVTKELSGEYNIF